MRVILDGTLCVAPVKGMPGWFRAVVLAYFDEDEHVLISYIDHGGYSRIHYKNIYKLKLDFSFIVSCFIFSIFFLIFIKFTFGSERIM